MKDFAGWVRTEREKWAGAAGLVAVERRAWVRQGVGALPPAECGGVMTPCRRPGEPSGTLRRACLRPLVSSLINGFGAQHPGVLDQVSTGYLWPLWSSLPLPPHHLQYSRKKSRFPASLDHWAGPATSLPPPGPPASLGGPDSWPPAPRLTTGPHLPCHSPRRERFQNLPPDKALCLHPPRPPLQYSRQRASF